MLAKLSSVKPIHAVWPAGALAALAAVFIFAAMNRQQTQLVARDMTAGDPSRAPVWIRRYGCSGCHTIPGIPGADGQVGGPLSGMRSRIYIAGVVTNTPEHLLEWIVDPQKFSPRTAMPASGISVEQARDVAAYLYGR